MPSPEVLTFASGYNACARNSHRYVPCSRNRPENSPTTPLGAWQGAKESNSGPIFHREQGSFFRNECVSSWRLGAAGPVLAYNGDERFSRSDDRCSARIAGTSCQMDRSSAAIAVQRRNARRQRRLHLHRLRAQGARRPPVPAPSCLEGQRAAQAVRPAHKAGAACS